jgi:hypothetical protein
MKIFKRRSGSSGFRPTEPLRTYEVSIDLGWCESFAFQVAHFRDSSITEARDLLGGIYIATLEFPRLSQYWKTWQDFEELVLSECGNLGARLVYWLPPWDPGKRPKKGFYALSVSRISPPI